VDNAVTDSSAEVGITIANSVEGVAASTSETGEYDILNAAGDGALASAIALGQVAATDTTRTCICLVRGPAVVKQTELAFGDGTEDDAVAALLALGIKCA
jgi:hypothetical protein